MSDLQECLQNRYKMMDELVTNIGDDMPGDSQSELTHPGLRLMCNFWNILKDDPTCNLQEEVQNHFQDSITSSEKYDSKQTTYLFRPRVLQCYMAQLPDQSNVGAPGQKQDQNPNLFASTPSSPSSPTAATASSRPIMPEKPPLKHVLTNLNNAATFDSQCQAKLKELLAAEKYLKSQISKLEAKEKQGLQMMEQADEMWLNMENSYKEKIAQSSERQQGLIRQLQDIEQSAAKWRKNKKDLEEQIGILNKCQSEMMEKINQKTNDLKSIDNDIAAYKKRIENTKKETETLKKLMDQRKKSADERYANINKEITNLQNKIQEETKNKNQLVEKGKNLIADARADLQKICKTLLKRRLEAEDLKAEKIALIEEIEALKKSCDHCKDRCSNKQNTIAEEIKKTDLEIANFNLKCRKCTQCVDCKDFRTLCTDCPRCQEYRVCKVTDKECKLDPAEECVCSKVKRIFLDNVFENMSTVLEKTVRTNAGKALGGEILKCLKRSTNAKLNDRTRKMLQEYVLQSVKQNLNLTIVGGAVKTRCELDSDIYKQLMLCLKGVQPKPPPKSEKGTNVKKEPCKHWGGHTECNCPKGPDHCICGRKAPRPDKDPKTCPPEPPEDPGERKVCPEQNKPCGPDCGAHNTFDMDRVGADVAKFRPDACSKDVCTFRKNMRAAQCVLGPESLKPPEKSKPSKSKMPNLSPLDSQLECYCGKHTVTPCPCKQGAKQLMPGKQNYPDIQNSSFKCKRYEYSPDRNLDKKSLNSEKGHVLDTNDSMYPMNKAVKSVAYKNPFLIVVDSEKESDAVTDTITTEFKFSNTISKHLGTEGNESQQLSPSLSINLAGNMDNSTTPLVQYPNQIPYSIAIDSSDHVKNKASEDINTPISTEPKTPISDGQKSGSAYQTTNQDESKLNYEDEQYMINIEFTDESGVSTTIDSFIQKTKSGNVALDVSGIDGIENISSTEKEHPVFLRKSASGTYKLYAGHQAPNKEAPNAVLRRTPFNGLLVVVTEPITKFVTEEDAQSGESNKEFYKIKLKGMSEKEMIPPAILLSSPSFNYVIVIDKEFEKKLTDSLDSAFDENGECFVDLHKNSSNISINFDKNSKKNAVLVKTPSENIKVLVNGPVFENLSDKKGKIRKNDESMNGKNNVPNISKAKSSSDSNMQKKALEKSCSLARTSAKFKRTPSGQYEAILDKESRIRLMNSLQSNLAQSCQKQLPLQISDSGDITIFFNRDKNEIPYVGSLKITPSGKVYIVVDESVVKDIEQREKLKFGSQHIIGKVKHPKNKSTCCGVCEECDHLKVSLKESSDSSVQLTCGCDLMPRAKRVCENRNCDPDSCTADCCTSETDRNPKYCPGPGPYYDLFYFTESPNSYEENCLLKDISDINDLCKRLRDEGSQKSYGSRRRRR